MSAQAELRRAARILREGHEVRYAPNELAHLLAAIAKTSWACPPPVVDAARRVASALTTVPDGEPLDRRLTEIEREVTE
ncbi:hypothetical protein CDO52_00835 [Nocardiopsis gilva YIM 90087]|uniref:Uncharacterized protein n=1 Tax=Nocardiopsis gilva YIM 90087 TaxID=1235441 RepID=A0A223S085_9ACTN|nr:hypothetical protein [Nocardiopsis gilva]ASU81524.1 hypothetical protein CDO52_00835 [Nocardiopsis gilva YIM 90087]